MSSSNYILKKYVRQPGPTVTCGKIVDRCFGCGRCFGLHLHNEEPKWPATNSAQEDIWNYKVAWHVQNYRYVLHFVICLLQFQLFGLPVLSIAISYTQELNCEREKQMGSSGSMVRALEREESKSIDQDELGFKPKVFWIQFQRLQEEMFTQQTRGWQSSWKSYMNHLGMTWQIQPFLVLWKFTKWKYAAVWITDEQYGKPSDVYIFAHKSSHIRNYQYCPQL